MHYSFIKHLILLMNSHSHQTLLQNSDIDLFKNTRENVNINKSVNKKNAINYERSRRISEQCSEILVSASAAETNFGGYEFYKLFVINNC